MEAGWGPHSAAEGQSAWNCGGHWGKRDSPLSQQWPAHPRVALRHSRPSPPLANFLNACHHPTSLLGPPQGPGICRSQGTKRVGLSLHLSLLWASVSKLKRLESQVLMLQVGPTSQEGPLPASLQHHRPGSGLRRRRRREAESGSRLGPRHWCRSWTVGRALLTDFGKRGRKRKAGAGRSDRRRAGSRRSISPAEWHFRHQKLAPTSIH